MAFASYFNKKQVDSNEPCTVDMLPSKISLLMMHCSVCVCCVCVCFVLFVLTEDSEPEQDTKGISSLPSALLLLFT